MHEHAAAWIAASGRAEVAAALEAIYAEVAGEVEARGPACWASGRCCNFRKAGHLLYVTGLEAAYTIARAEGIRGFVEATRSRRSDESEKTNTPGAVSLTQLANARERDDCPFLIENACSVHAIKPLGCRVYFCDRSAQQWQQDLSERMLARIRELHERFGVPYVYAEWRGLLETVSPGLGRGTGYSGDLPLAPS